jgi:tetratricopeptide (TPR) repeat protein
MLRWLAKPGRWLTALCEWPLSRRACPLVFLALAAVLTLEAWLRPPFSRDVRSYQIPLGIWKTCSVTDANGAFRVDSVGVALLALLVVEMIWLARRPQSLSSAAGVLLVAAIAGNAIAVFNHPAWIERFDQEYEQRRQVIEGVSLTVREDEPLSRKETGRINAQGDVTSDLQRGDLVRGLVYLRYGWWMIPFAAAGVLAGRVPMRRRARNLLAWTALGILVAAAACSQRLVAEYFWQRSLILEDRCQYAEARAAIDRAVAVCPEFQELQRTWLFAGKVDSRLHQRTPEETFFRLYQYARDRERPRTLACRQDLPWLIPGTEDYREGLATQPCGYDLSLAPGIAYTGAFDQRRGFLRRKLPTLTGIEADALRRYQLRWAVALSDELLAHEHANGAPVLSRSAQLWTEVGIERYLYGGLDKTPYPMHFEDSQTLAGAQTAWQRALTLSPEHVESRFLLGLSEARLVPTDPAKADSQFGDVLEHSGDLTIRADMLLILGDAYFQAGQYQRAQKCYVESFDLFNVPQAYRNFRAQRRLGGI